MAAFGCTIGIVPHMAAAIMGLAALLHTSALAFETFKYLGVAYLLYMAWNTLRERGALRVEKEVGPRSSAQVTVTAILINILNPKLSIFFLAFLPQFVSVDESNPLARMLLLSAVFMLMTFVVFVGYGLFAASIRDHVISRPRVLDLDAPQLCRRIRRRSAPGWPSPIAERNDRTTLECCAGRARLATGCAAMHRVFQHVAPPSGLR